MTILYKTSVLTESKVFLKSIQLMHCLNVFHFLKYLLNADYMITSSPVTSKSKPVIPYNFVCKWS